MPYLTIPQAAEASGKSEKTIRRLANRPESKPFITREGNTVNAPVLIDANYLQTIYPLSTQKMATHSVDTSTHAKPTSELTDTQADYIAFLKEQLKRKEDELSQKDKRIEDLTDKLTSIRLLTEGKPEELPSKKRRWWRF